jgi:prevent-host-death family protein
MKVVTVEDGNLAECVRASRRHDRVIVTRRGKPVAMIVGVKGLDLEQLELGYSDKFWTQVDAWRKQPTVTRAELERRLGGERPKRKTGSG